MSTFRRLGVSEIRVLNDSEDDFDHKITNESLLMAVGTAPIENLATISAAP